MGESAHWHKHRFGFIMQSFKVEKWEVSLGPDHSSELKVIVLLKNK